jgi:hypothetical protein
MKTPTRESTDMNKRTLSRWMLVTVASLASTPQSVRGQTSIQRTITSSPSSITAPNNAPDPIDGMLRQYREMWQKMGPAQQKAFLDAGGSAPDQYERTLRTKGLSAVPPAPVPLSRQTPSDPRAAVNALDSLTTSLQDLNAIRDGNLGRVQKDGCPPEVTSRLADLRGKLRQYETELTGVEAPAPSPSQAKERPGLTDTMAIANDWFKRSPQDQPETLGQGAGNPSSLRNEADTNNHESKLLAGVLSSAPAAAAPERRMDPKSPEALQKQKALEEEIALLKVEIAQLSGACTALRR